MTARGKTHISRALERYLRWLGVKTRVYSLGDYRRRVLGGAKNLPPDYFAINPSMQDGLATPLEEAYFEDRPRSEATNALRRRVKNELEEQIMEFFLTQKGQVVIYDANNGHSTARRECIQKFESKGVHVIFLGSFRPCPLESMIELTAESLCDKNDIIERNIRSVKLSSPDVRSLPSTYQFTSSLDQYKGWDADRAVADYWGRIREQEEQYQTVRVEEGPYIKIMNVGETIEVNRIEGECIHTDSSLRDHGR